MSLLGNQFTGKRTIRASDGAIATSQGQSTIKAGKGTIWAAQKFNAASSSN